MFLRHCSVGYENAQNALEKSKVLVRTKIRQNDSLQTRYTGKIYNLSYCFHFAGIKKFRQLFRPQVSLLKCGKNLSKAPPRSRRSKSLLRTKILIAQNIFFLSKSNTVVLRQAVDFLYRQINKICCFVQSLFIFVLYTYLFFVFLWTDCDWFSLKP